MLYQQAAEVEGSDIAARIDFFSGLFLGRPYLLNALGEGNAGFFDQAPLYRTDAFDCETYVDTVLALALANDSETFKRYIRQVRYRNGHVSFIDRNHFTCLDWNKNNQTQGFVHDITASIKSKNGKNVAVFAQALIDKPSWYQHFSIQKIRITPDDMNEKAKRLSLLKKKGRQLPKSISTIPYIPLSSLFDKHGHTNMALFNQIPNASIIEIIRPNWDLSKEIGTHLNVSHLGFAIWKNGKLLFRETSSKDGRALDIALVDYLRETLQSPTIEGINIQMVLDPKTAYHVSKYHLHPTT